jgi:hypothetical protein
VRNPPAYRADDRVAVGVHGRRGGSRVVRRLTGCVPFAWTVSVGTTRGMSYPSDLTDEQWDLLEPVFNAPGKRGHACR